MKKTTPSEKTGLTVEKVEFQVKKISIIIKVYTVYIIYTVYTPVPESIEKNIF